MKGVVFPGNSRAEVRQFADPSPREGEVVVRIRASGMCGSDLHPYRADTVAPSDELLIQGHEPCGEVCAVAAGIPPHVAAVGDRVMIHHYWGCGICVSCRSGWPQLCSVIEPRVPTLNEHGGHAEYFRVPALQTIGMPEELSFPAGAAIGCGTGTAWGALQRLGDIAGKSLAVVGQGPVGASVTMLASALGARVIAVDIAQKRLNLAGKLGAESLVDAAAVDVVDAVHSMTKGRGADLIVETSGSTPAAKQSIDMLAIWGKLCLIGIGADIHFNTAVTLRKQMTILTSWTLSTVQQIECAAFIVTHALPIDDLFSHTWTLSQAPKAYDWFDRQADGKGVFVL